MSLASRLAVLSQQELIDLVVLACDQSQDVKNRADAFVAKAAPLPVWCVDEVLLSPDLLPSLMATLELRHAARWHATERMLRVDCYFVEARCGVMEGVQASLRPAVWLNELY